MVIISAESPGMSQRRQRLVTIMLKLTIPDLLKEEFATVETLWHSTGKTRRVDALMLSSIKPLKVVAATGPPCSVCGARMSRADSRVSPVDTLRLLTAPSKLAAKPNRRPSKESQPRSAFSFGDRRE